MSIASRIEAIEEHIGDIYDTLETSGADLTNVDKNIVNINSSLTSQLEYYLSNGLEVLWNNWEKVTGTGTSLSLQNTLEGKMYISPKGNTSQYTTTGKNLFPRNEAITLTKGGTRTIQINFPTPIPAGTYTFNCKITNKSGLTSNAGLGGSLYDGSTSRGQIIYVSTGTTSPYTRTVTTTGQSTHIYIYVDNSLSDGATVTLEEMMLVSGSTSGTYEPYTNGASPNPTYPQNIDVVSGDNTITIANSDNTESKSYSLNLGKNLFDYTTTTFSQPQYVNIETNDNIISITTTQTTSNNNLFFMTKIPDEYLVNGETYTISSVNVGGVYQNLKIQLRNKNGTYANKAGATSVVYDDTYSLYVTGNPFATSDVSVPSGSVCVIKNVQVERGSSATSYSEYFEPIELCKIGTYQDKIYKENDKWYLHKEIGKVVLNGGESWSSWDSTRHRMQLSYSNMSQPLKYNSTGYSNYLSFADTGTNIGFNFGSTALFVRISDTFTQMSDATTWLSNHNTILYGVLATPTNTEITDNELINELEAFKSKTGTTNISQDGIAELDVVALKKEV